MMTRDMPGNPLCGTAEFIEDYGEDSPLIL